MKQLLFSIFLMAIINHLSAQNVGIGTQTPEEKLEVTGNIRLSAGANRNIVVTPSPAGVSGNNLKISAGNTTESPSASGGGDLELWGGRSNAVGIQAGGNIILTTGLNFWSDQNGKHGDIVFRGGNKLYPQSIVEFARMDGTSGNWGFGTATPTARLDVVGTVKATGFQLTTGATNGFVLQSDANGVATWVNATSLAVTETDPQVGVINNGYLPMWNGTALVTSTIWQSMMGPVFVGDGLNVSGRTYLAANTGIGTAADLVTRLDVAGTGGLRVSSTNPGTGIGDWISGNFGGTAGDRVVMGNQSSVATIGAHNNALNAWSNLAINPGGGNVGIGMATPHATLQLSNIIANRRFVLWEDVNNDHQFYGFGVNSSVLRYQVPTTAASHIFYAGTSTTTSQELVRIQGNGNMGVATSTPAAKLDVNGNFRLGSSGTVLNNVIRFEIGLGVVAVGANNSAAISVGPVGGAVTGSTVYVSPSAPLPAGMSIGFARVPVNGTVEVVFVNGTNANQNIPAMTYYVTVIN